MTSTLSLPARCDTAAADTLLEQIKALRGKSLCIDAKGCGGIGALCAGILVAALRAWRRDGQDFAFVNTDGIAADLMLLGVAECLLEMEPVK
jgi:anti-anti-sigma regulatory factor